MGMRTEKEHEDNDWVTMSFRLKHRHAIMVHAAADQSAEGLSTASKMRQLVLQWMASELRCDVPDYSTSEINQGDMAQVAAQIGLTPREFMALAARELAASMKTREAKQEASNRPTSRPPRRMAATSGTHKIEIQGTKSVRPKAKIK